jgi:protein-disulfide isomerase
MLRRTMIYLWAVLMLTVLAACGGDATPASPAATASAPPTRAPAAATPAPTAASLPAATAAPTTASAAQPESSGAATIPEGLTPEGYHMRGNPDAPVTLVMYSDFL